MAVPVSLQCCDCDIRPVPAAGNAGVVHDPRIVLHEVHGHLLVDLEDCQSKLLGTMNEILRVNPVVMATVVPLFWRKVDGIAAQKMRHVVHAAVHTERGVCKSIVILLHDGIEQHKLLLVGKPAIRRDEAVGVGEYL